ncbi:hypothetical protein [Longimicrobium sp.]|uniref:hypothetical protein n=1 Tax=Longimicrobium sp. TaxID=2029185 RepID=UPI002BD882F3|nr:hypothetical protein [Longimicrobium sp.]HSU15432.1 hypothetical protein [Longimicrobium sp.]
MRDDTGNTPPEWSVPPEQPGGAGGGGRGYYSGPPPYGEQPVRDPDATRRGVRAALIIFGIVIAMHLVLFAAVKLSGDSNNAWLFLPEGVLVVIAALVAAIVVSIKLPVDSRVSFWAVGVGCMFLSFIIWGATCAIAL